MPPKRMAEGPPEFPSSKRRSVELSPQSGSSWKRSPNPAIDLPYTTDGRKDLKQDATNEDGVTAFYPPEMSNERAKAYIDGKIPTPMQEVEKALKSTMQARLWVPLKDAVVMWFRTDLRLHDNTALYYASNLAAKSKRPLIALFVFSHQDFEAHLTSPARIDFIIRTLRVLKHDLEKLNIPLWIEELFDRTKTVDIVLSFCQRWNAGKIFANLQ